MKRRCLQKRLFISLASLIGLGLSLLIVTCISTKKRVDAAGGRQTFGWLCSSCHGIYAQGDGPKHTQTLPEPANLTLVRDSPEMIRSIIRHGVKGTAMPAFGPIATDKIIRDASEYFTSQPPNTFLQWSIPWTIDRNAPPAGIAPTLYVTSCAGCHGATGAGDGPWAAGDSHIWPKPANFHARNSDVGRNYYIITNGRASTMMPPHLHNIPDQARWELACYVAGMFEPNSMATILHDNVDLYRNPYATDNAVVLSEGHRIYQLYCSGCHGFKGQGSFLAPSLIDRIWYYGGGTSNAMFAIISKGTPGNLMPSFASLSTQKRWEVITYLRLRGGLPQPLAGVKPRQ